MTDPTDIEDFRRQMLMVVDAAGTALKEPGESWKNQLQGLTIETFSICQFLVALAIAEAEEATHLSRNGVCREMAAALEDKAKATDDPTSALGARIVSDELRPQRDNPGLRDGVEPDMIRGAYFEVVVVSLVALRDAWRLQQVDEVLARFQRLVETMDLRPSPSLN